MSDSASTVEAPVLTDEQILAAATNSPVLSPDQFKLGDQTFKIVHLPYDDYVTFLGYLQPFLSAMVLGKSKEQKVSIPGINLGVGASPLALVEFCSNELPEMVRLIVKQTDPTVTVKTIKELAGTPFVLAGIVFQQLVRNQMIADFASFFKQMMPLLSLAK